jgi:hypothetical protein
MKKWDSGIGVIIQELPNVEQLMAEEDERLKNLTYANVKFKIEDAFKSNIFHGLMFNIPKDLKSCECRACRFSRIYNFCSYHQGFLNIEGCSAYKEAK